MSIAVVFSGQGSQHPDMLPWLDERAPLLAACHDLLGIADWRTALADPAWARANRPAQVVITATALTAWSQLAEALPPLVGIAGYSVGELAACSAAGLLAPATTLHLAHRRALLMDDAGRAQPGGLMGLTGLLPPAIDKLLATTRVSLAICNGEDSVVLGGPLEDIARVEADATALGGRCTRLGVSVASHTPWMDAAATAFEEELQAVPMAPPTLPFFSNSGDRVWRPAQARALLARQIRGTVQWAACMDQLAQQGPACVLEVGGGQALARLWNQRHPKIPARAADAFRTLDGLVAWVRRNAER